MSGLFAVKEMNSAMTNIAGKVSDAAGIVNYYPMLKKATSSSNQPTPGYIYEQLIVLSFSSKESSVYLVEYLNSRLQRPAPYGVLKTLKTINHLVDRGSREVRRGFRRNEEFIKGAKQFGGQNNLLVGTTVLQEIQTLVDGLLTKLFDEDLRLKDESDEPELVPSISELSGMGNTPSLASSKYQGFGNSPINKTGIGESLREMVDSVLAVPETNKQIQHLCLDNSTGDYQAVQIGNISETQQSFSTRKLPQVKAHTPGRAGGGWEDEEKEDLSLVSALSSLVASDNDDQVVPDITNSAEYRIVGDFCSIDGLPVDIVSLRQTFDLLSCHCVTDCLFSVMAVCESGGDTAKLRGLLLVEKFLQSPDTKIEIVATVFNKMSHALLKSNNTDIVNKTKKIEKIIEKLKSLKSG